MGFFEPDDIFVNNTLSVRTVPGQDKLFPSTSTEAIFTFGDFRIERNLSGFFLDNNADNLTFDRLENLTSLTTVNFDATRALGLTQNDLNLNLTDPNSYSYFGSYYSKLASTVNKIIENYPYAILDYDSNTGETNFIVFSSIQLSYTEITLISSAFTNQGNIIFTSGNSFSSLSANTLTLFDNYDKFEIQLSSTTLNTTPSFPILSYNYSAYSDYYHLNFRLGGIFSANTTDAIYIRPSKKRYFQYKRSLQNLEYQLLEGSKFSVPNPSNDQFFEKTITWPRTIDGFAPDSNGDNFDDYVEELLYYAKLTDQLKTNWLIRTIIPENFLELDSDGQVYNKIIQTYGDEFDKIKGFIDNLAFSHSINYTESETVSNKFLSKLTQLLGWSQPINFTDTDFFEYLGQEDDNNKTLEDYNFDLWRRILTNINWLYKRKGTRDAIMFMFKLIGAPPSIITFNEFVYEVQRNANPSLAETSLTSVDSTVFFVASPIGKVNQNGFVNYAESIYAFQEGGPGRGNGRNFIDQWTPEFDPTRKIDNIKIKTGDTNFFGTENLINTKELEVGLDPAGAIENDMFEWYKIPFFYTGNTSVNLPDDYKISDVDLVVPSNISAMTLSEWLNYVYNENIEVTNRKTTPASNHNYFYPNLRKIYLTYYYWNVSNELSNRINFLKLEQFLRLVESKIFVYIQQMVPATSIFEGVASIYRNTLFNRQKFVYPKGINDGSEFKTRIPDQFNNNINGNTFSISINRNIFNSNITSSSLNISSPTSFNLNVNGATVNSQISTGLNLNINGVSVSSNVLSSTTQVSQAVGLNGSTTGFPLSGIPTGNPPNVSQPYTGNTFSGGNLGPQPFNPSPSGPL